MTTYAPSCAACRDNDPRTFYRSCEGCQARKARLEAARVVPALTQKQVDGMDSTMQPLASPRRGR